MLEKAAGATSSSKPVLHVQLEEVGEGPDLSARPVNSVSAGERSVGERNRRGNQPAKHMDERGRINAAGLCFYHARFGKKARFCVCGCAKASENC